MSSNKSLPLSTDSSCSDTDIIPFLLEFLYSICFSVNYCCIRASFTISNWALLSFISYAYTICRISSSLFSIGFIFFLYCLSIRNFRSQILQILPSIFEPFSSLIEFGKVLNRKQQSLQNFIAQNSHVTGFLYLSLQAKQQYGYRLSVS